IPNMSFGNMPLDGGNLLLTVAEKNELLKNTPQATKFLKKVIGSHEYINNEERWCLWLIDASPTELKQMPEVLKRIDSVKKFRESSIAPSTRKFALTPALFRDRNLPEMYIVIPGVSSERRTYIPMGLLQNDVIPTNLVHMVPNGNLYHFGILTSLMHMAWVKNVCGRLKSDYRYSKDIVYNNYPFPENPTEKQIKAIETAAQRVLDARLEFPNSSLADLYDPLTMPPALVKAHNDLDKSVDLAYRPQPFTSEANRMVFLFELYEKYTAGLFTETKKKKKNAETRTQ
ncbi:MAG: type IIL restriction-modification enzyme MmeI, partial [Acidobacteriota bacterium]